MNGQRHGRIFLQETPFPARFLILFPEAGRHSREVRLTEV